MISISVSSFPVVIRSRLVRPFSVMPVFSSISFSTRTFPLRFPIAIPIFAGSCGSVPLTAVSITLAVLSSALTCATCTAIYTCCPTPLSTRRRLGPGGGLLAALVSRRSIESTFARSSIRLIRYTMPIPSSLIATLSSEVARCGRRRHD